MIRAAHAREARALREAAHLDRALARARDLVDRARERRVLDERVVGGVEDQHRITGARPRHPRLEVCARHHRAGRVVGRTEIGDLDRRGRRIRNESVALGRGQVGDARIAPLRVGGAGAAGHHVRVDVDRIDRVGDRERRALVEDLLDVAAVLFAAVGDEDLVGRDLDTARAVVVFADRVEQEVVAVLGSVAAETLRASHLDARIAHRLDDRGRERRASRRRSRAGSRALRGSPRRTRARGVRSRERGSRPGACGSSR